MSEKFCSTMQIQGGASWKKEVLCGSKCLGTPEWLPGEIQGSLKNARKNLTTFQVFFDECKTLQHETKLQKS